MTEQALAQEWAGNDRAEFSASMTDPPKKSVIREEWTAERDAILIEERGRGTARRVIADIINEKTNSHFTKAAVCGRIDRLFPIARPIKTEEEKAATKTKQRERDRLKKQRQRSKRKASPDFMERQKRRREYAARQTREIVCIKPAHTNGNGMRVYRSIVSDLPTLRCVEIEPRHLTLLDLEKGDCRYPYGDSEITFCGHPSVEGSSYCRPHHDLCWSKPLPHKASGKPVLRAWSAA